MSYWAVHPSLVDALALGRDFEEWLAGRTPVVSYARVSRDAAGDERGVGRQHLNNDDAAARLGWAVVHRFTDNALTASDPRVERPAFLQMLRVIRAQQTEEDFGSAVSSPLKKNGWFDWTVITRFCTEL